MANQLRSRLTQSGIPEAPPPPRGSGGGRGRLLAVGGAVLAALLALAWYDGGEEPLRPIAQDIQLPEAAR